MHKGRSNKIVSFTAQKHVVTIVAYQATVVSYNCKINGHEKLYNIGPKMAMMKKKKFLKIDNRPTIIIYATGWLKKSWIRGQS
jgi:hypothetical protein